MKLEVLLNSFGMLASPTIEILNTWSEMFPKAVALMAEVLAIDRAQGTTPK
jgi:hypothetical protein